MSQPEPEHLDIAGPTSPLEITWVDGHKSSYELEYLRRMCPCAQCTNHGATPLKERIARTFPARATTVKNVEEVGHYAIAITWGDGHNTGIYSFQHLRQICSCALCMPSPEWEV